MPEMPGRVIPASIDPEAFYEVKLFRAAVIGRQTLSPAHTIRKMKGSTLQEVIDSVFTATLLPSE